MTTALAPARTLRIGPIELDAPVVLAPMAGITNTAFRRLCREYGAGLYVSEMITSRALVERNATTMRLITHHESETPRSIQLYGVDPATVAERRAHPRRRGPRRSHRPEFRMPRPQGHPQGRRRRAAVEARALPRHRDARRARRGRHPAHRQDAQGHRRRSPDVPRRRPHRRGRRASRPSRSTRAPPRSSTPGRPTGRRSRSSKRPSRASPCSATATSGRPTTPCA